MRSKEYIINLLKFGKHFCVMPWIHLYVMTNGNMGPCCLQLEGPDSNGYGSLNANSLSELWQGEAIRNLRLKMIADEMNQSCMNCYENEKLHIPSLRMQSNEMFLNYWPWVMNTDDKGCAPQAVPIYWDIRISNLCNLKCRICGYSSSSSWFQDAKALGFLDSNTSGEVFDGLKDLNTFLGDLKQYYPYVQKIYFAGGEPFLFKENLALLEDLHSMKKYEIILEYSSNFTYINPKLIELWKNFPRLSFLVSLDGNHQRGEYQRKGLAWDDIIRNLDHLKQECPHARILINCTVSAFNILHLPEFHQEMVEKGYIEEYQMSLIILQSPEFYNVKILPAKLKKQATQKIQEHIVWLVLNRRFYFVHQWQACIDYMNSEDWSNLIPNFIEITNQLDHLRNEKCIEVFPELEPIFSGDYHL